MKTAELRNMDEEALHKSVAEQREELLKLRFQLATGALENTSRLREVKRGLARTLTVLNSRRGEAGTTSAAAPAATTPEQTENSDA